MNKKTTNASDESPCVCIVGRPNVGKSSLFNCMLGERRAVVMEESGTTRDRAEAMIKLRGYSFKIVDTGGYTSGDDGALSAEVKEQIYNAVEEADILLMVADASSGVVPGDEETVSILRKFNKPAVLVVNKADNPRIEKHVPEFYRLGMGDPVSISCAHRKGMDALEERILGTAREMLVKKPGDGVKYLKIAIVGRPNVGKSSFLNALLQTKRVIVSEIPGTTRDSIDTFFKWGGDEYLLIDTAGIRHGRKTKSVVDTFSIMRSRESVRRADVAFLIVDASSGVTQDDVGILDLIEESGKACLIVVNKWDLAEGSGATTQEEYKRHMLYALDRLSKYPVMFASSITGKNILETLSTAKVLDANMGTKLSTPFLNKLFAMKDPSLVPVPRRKKRPNFLYITQTGERPIRFTVFVNDPGAVLSSHLSFIENLIRDNCDLVGIPISIRVKASRKNSHSRTH